ncbi:MAG: DUF2851 family protein [Muribaculaceae bacterium]|nr:DUF2851 family protein [Muribaculaceae bacterium]
MEEIFQLLWQSRMLGLSFPLEGGGSVRVMDPGTLNRDSGPDFFNAKVKIDGKTWAGNIEIHMKASDWHRHGHDSDPAYDNVILHVVALSDTTISRRDGSAIPQMNVRLPENFYRTFAYLTGTAPETRCASRLHIIDSIRRADWIETLSIERLQHKATRIEETLRNTHGDWNAACFLTLARALGFGLNGIPFEMLAQSIDLNHLRRHSDNILQMEAIFFGQAGMLDPTVNQTDRRYQLMCREYQFLARKYSMHPIPRASWKFARTRPQNLPYRRIALLAKAMAETPDLLQRIIKTEGDEDMLRQLFRWQVDPYWSRRYTFGADGQTEANPPSLSEPSISVLLINVAAPLLYAYALLHCDHDLKEAAAALLTGLPPEKNSIIRNWEHLGLKAKDAATSQALIHLRREFCDRHECLRCRFGHYLLRCEAVAPAIP